MSSITPGIKKLFLLKFLFFLLLLCKVQYDIIRESQHFEVCHATTLCRMFSVGCIYGRNDDGHRFGFFCHAALEFLLQSGFQPVS